MSFMSLNRYKPLVIFHGRCLDGIASAWVLHHNDKSGYDYFSANYQEAPPDVTNRRVIIVDFSYERDVLIEMASKAKSILIFDHHQGALERFSNMPTNVTTCYRADISGAIITWDWFNQDKACPYFLRLISDGDLYTFRHPETRSFQAGIIAQGALNEKQRSNVFKIFDSIYNYADTDRNMVVTELCVNGSIIIESQKEEIASQIENSLRYGIVGEYLVPIANISRNLRNQAAELMYPNELFSMTYCDTSTHREFSLRNAKGGLDLIPIAKQYGGSGHSSAAGFKLLLSDPLCHELIQERN